MAPQAAAPPLPLRSENHGPGQRHGGWAGMPALQKRVVCFAFHAPSPPLVWEGCRGLGGVAFAWRVVEGTSVRVGVAGSGVLRRCVRLSQFVPIVPHGDWT